MLRTRIAPIVRALLVITALVLGQVQIALAVDAPDSTGLAPVGHSVARSSAAETPADVLRQDPINGCNIYVNTYLLTAPFDGPVPGVGGDNGYGAEYVDTRDNNPGTKNPSPEVERETGDVLSWLVVVENSSLDCNGGSGPEDRLFNIEATVTFSDSSGASYPPIDVDSQFIWPDPANPDELAADGDIAWTVFDWIVPPDIRGNLNIRTLVETESDQDPRTGIDVRDLDSDEIGIAGPGIKLLSFQPDPPQSEAAFGESIDYKLRIQNTRANSTILYINVTSENSSQFAAACSGIGNWEPDGGGTPLTELASEEIAECTILDVPVTGDPPPKNFTISGVIEVSEQADGVSDLNYELEVTSDPVAVQLPEVEIDKAITRVRRGSEDVPLGPDLLVLPGDVITYTITVTNPGAVELRNIRIVDSLTGPIYVAPGTLLPPAGELTFTTTHTVREDSQDPLQNTVTVTADASGFSASVDAQAVASVDVADSLLVARLEALNPADNSPWEGGVQVGDTVRYRLRVRNLGSETVSELSYVTLPLPLKTLTADGGPPPAFSPSTVVSGAFVEVVWDYPVTVDDDDPMVNTVRVRGRDEGGTLLYSQTQVTLDLVNPDIAISAVVTRPDPEVTETLLRGQEVAYRVTVENTGGTAICGVQIDQIRRDPNTGLEYPVASGLPVEWAGTPGQILPGGSVQTAATYLVTGEDVDPLQMIFEVNGYDCTLPTNELTDRTTRTLDISDVQLNTILTPTVDSLQIDTAEVGTAIQFIYQAVNVSAMTLENLNATWCVYRDGTPVANPCGEPFDAGGAIFPGSLGAFETGTDEFAYTISSADAQADTFSVVVTLTGTDNKDNFVTIKTATSLPISTPNVSLTVSGVNNAVMGDTIPFDFRFTNSTGEQLSNVKVYNMLVDDVGTPTGFLEVGSFSYVESDGEVTGSFDYTIDSLAGISDDVLTMRLRATGERLNGEPVLANASTEVEILPMVGVQKSGPNSAAAGTQVTYTMTIVNNSQSQVLEITQYVDDVLAANGVDVDSDSYYATWPPLEDGGAAVPGFLPPKGSVSGSFSIPAVPAYPTPLSNTFIVRGLRPDGTPVSGQDTHVVRIACPVDFNFLVSNQDDDPDDVLGETLRWEISFTNISLETINNLTIIEDLEWGGVVPEAEIIWPGTQGVLEPGETAWITGQSTDQPYYEMVITSEYYSNDDDDFVPNSIRADFSEVGGASDCQESYSYSIYSPIEVYKVPSVPVAFVGEVVEYDFIVANITEADDAPYDEFFVTVYDSMLTPNPVPFDYDGDGDTEGSGILGPGEVVEATLTREILASDPDKLKNVAVAEFPDPVETDITYFTRAEATVYTGDLLEVTKTPSTAKAAAGASITYDYSISNVSPYPVEILSVVDDLIGELAGEGDLDPLIPDSPDFDTTVNLLDVPYTIPEDAVGSVKNTVTVTARVEVPLVGARTITVDASAIVGILAPDIDLQKTVHYNVNGDVGDEIDDSIGVADGVPDVESGTDIFYCFRVENTNPNPDAVINNIFIQDAVFPNLQESFTTAVETQLGHTGDALTTLGGGEVVTFCEPYTLVASPDVPDPFTNVVTVNAELPNETPIFAKDSVTVDIRGTTLIVTKLPSQTVAFVGDDVTYTITLFNNDAGNDIYIEEVIDEFAGGGPVSIALDNFDWSQSKVDGAPVGVLGASGGQATFSYTYSVEIDDPDPLENTVSASGWLDDSDIPEERTPVYDRTRAVLAVSESQLIVRKEASVSLSNASPDGCEQPDGPNCVMVTYSVSITNAGLIPVEGVMAVDEHFNVETGTFDTLVFQGDDLSDTALDPLETAFISYTLPMPTPAQIAANPDLDPFLNTVTAYGIVLDVNGDPIPLPDELLDPDDPYDDDKSVKARATDTVDIVQPDMRTLKSAVTLAAAPGQNVTYNIQITNTGDTPLDGITVEDLADADPVLNLDTICAPGSVEVCNWVYGPDSALAGEQYDPVTHKLQPLEQLLGTVEVQVPADWAEAEFTNVVEITATTETETTISDRTSATIDIRSDGIEVVKSASASNVPIGAVVSYTVTVTNVGSSSIDRLTFADSGMDGVPGGNVVVETGFPDDPDIAGDDTGTLDSGESYTLPYDHTIIADDAPVYINSVSVTGVTTTGSAVLNIDQAAVEVDAADIGIEKFACVGFHTTLTPPEPCETVVNVGDDVMPDTVTYYIHIFNPGAVTINEIAVTDSFGLVPDYPLTLTPNDGVPDSGTDEAWLRYYYDVLPGDPKPLTNLATVSGVAEGGAPVQASAQAALELVTSDLLVTKSGPAEAVVGETVTYTITIENTGASGESIQIISATDPLSDEYGATDITPCLQLLGPGAIWPCTITHTVTQADNNPLENTVSVIGVQGGTTLVSDTASHSLEILTPGLSVSKIADQQYVTIGDEVTYTYRIENTGTVTISNLVVSDSDSNAETDPNWPAWPTSLSAGEIVIEQWTRTVTPQDNDPYANTLTVTGTASGTPVMAEATETVYIANGNLAVTNTPSVSFASAGDTVIFTYGLANLGLDPIVNLTISDNLCDDAVLDDQIPTELPPGAVYNVTCEATATLPGPLVSSVYATGDEVLSLDPYTVNPLSDTATAEVAVTSGGVLVVKTADRATVQPTAPDNVITYTIEVTNVGDEPLTDIVVDDPNVVGLSPAPPVTLSAGQSFMMEGTRTVTALEPDPVVNVVTVTATGTLTDNVYTDTDSASVAVVADPATATLVLSKSADVLTAQPGDPVTYTFTVRNISSTNTATGVQLVDPMLDDSLYTVDPPVTGGVVPLPDLGPGDAVTRTYTVTIPATYTAPQWVNNASVTSDLGENGQDTASVTVAVELLTLTKSATSPVYKGQTVTYTFDVTNNTTSTIENVTIQDDLGISWTVELPASIPPTGATAEAEYTVPVDFAETTLTNTATLLVDGVAVDESSVTVDVEEPVTSGLMIQIISITQTVGETELTVLQSGEPTQVDFEITNIGSVPINDLALTLVDVTGLLPGETGEVYCDLLGDPLPAGITPGATVPVSCTFIPPKGADDYITNGLTREVTATITGLADTEPVETFDTATFDLIDLMLVVELGIDPASGNPGDTVTFTLTITNAGASPVGCAVGDPCELSFSDGETPGILSEVFADDLIDLPDTVLLPRDDVGEAGGSLSYTRDYVIQDDDVTQTLTAVVEGGYYDAALEAADLLEYYTVYDDASVELVVDLPEIEATLQVIPLPPVFGETVNYIVTITNTGGVTVTNLQAFWKISPLVASVPNDDGLMLTSGGASPFMQTTPLEGQFTLLSTTLLPGESTTGQMSKIEDQDGAYQFLVTVLGDGIVGEQLVPATDSTFTDLSPTGTPLGTVTPTVDPETLDPEAVDPVVTKTASPENSQPGGDVTFTIEVRNSWTDVMDGVVVQDSVPATMTINSAETDRGATVIDASYVTASIGTLNPGEAATLTINATVRGDAPFPGIITNTACAQRSGGAQVCDTINVNLGADVTGLPATGIVDQAGSSGSAASFPWVGMLSAALLAGLVLMGAATEASRRRVLLAALFVIIALAIVVGAIILAANSGDDEAEPTGEAEAATVTPEGDGVEPVPPPELPDGGTMVFPPTATPYIAPTPAGVRTLMIPRLDAQFDAPVPIVDLPIVNRQWDVSGLGYYVGWLEGTTWMDSQWGNTVLAAHVQLGFQNPGPFWGLGDLQPGDEIIVQEGDLEHRFAVQSITKVDPEDWTVTAPTSSPMLTLITCTEWDNNYGVFSQRMVVRAIPVAEMDQG